MAILVGCDFSEHSDRALDRAVAIAARHGDQLVVVHAVADDAPLTHSDNSILEQITAVAAADRDQRQRSLADRITAIAARGVSAELVTRVGPPDEVFAQVASEHHGSLIVVGTQGHTGVGRFLLGSVAASTIRHAPCDVLVVRGTGTGAFSRPLIATDFSPTSAHLLEHASRVVDLPDLVPVVHAWQLPAGSWGANLLGTSRFPWSAVRDGVVAAAQARGQTQAAEYEAASGRKIVLELVQGPPAHVITHAAEAHHHDLIVVGAHGHRGVRRLLLGSVAESTVRHAPCSVLVVKG